MFGSLLSNESVFRLLLAVKPLHEQIANRNVFLPRSPVQVTSSPGSRIPPSPSQKSTAPVVPPELVSLVVSLPDPFVVVPVVLVVLVVVVGSPVPVAVPVDSLTPPLTVVPVVGASVVGASVAVPVAVPVDPLVVVVPLSPVAVPSPPEPPQAVITTATIHPTLRLAMSRHPIEDRRGDAM
jgi:hypothetical protein